MYSWPSVSGFYFDMSQSGGGVLIDTGPHVLDLLIWWLGEPSELRYTDDNFGGVEASCILETKMGNGAEGVVKLSRLVPMETLYLFEGTRGTLRANPFLFDTIKITLDNVGEFELKALGNTSLPFYFEAQLRNFVENIRSGIPLVTDGNEGRRVIQLIERCYGKRERLGAPWLMNS